MGEPVVEGRAHSVATDELADGFGGSRPTANRKHWQAYRGAFYRGGPILMSAIAGVDQALWDIKGKFHNAPVHQLLGGQVRNRIKVYAWVGGDRLADIGNRTTGHRRRFQCNQMNLTEELQVVDHLHKRRSRAYRQPARGPTSSTSPLTFMVASTPPWRSC